MSGQSSGTQDWAPPIAEILIEAFERCGKTVAALSIEQTRSGRRSLNFVLSSWTNKGVNLFTVTEYVTYMPQGVSQYVVPPQVVDVLADSVVVRQYQMGAPVSAVPAFTTTLNSATVTVAGLTVTPTAGGYLCIGVTTSVGGLILDGFYQVVSVPGSGQATITAAASATATVTAGGVVPQFVTTAGSNTVTVNFPNHGLLVGQSFTVEVTTLVGGITLLGPYTVATVPTANQFTITAPFPAGFAQTVSENGGDTMLSAQTTTQGLTQDAGPTDIQMYAMSRTEYVTIPNKTTQGRPTSFWNNRQISPVLNIWPTPDGNGPYELRYRASCQIQDADILNGQVMAIPYRFQEAFAAALTANLAMKVAPDRAEKLMQYAEVQWEAAAEEDREKVSFYLVPDLSGYTD